MARQVWTPCKVGYTGSCNVVFSSPSSEGEEFVQVFHKQLMLFENGSTMATAQNNITARFVTAYTLHSLALEDRDLTITGNARGVSPMMGKEYQQTTGYVYIDWPTWTASDMAGLKMALVQIST